MKQILILFSIHPIFAFPIRVSMAKYKSLSDEALFDKVRLDDTLAFEQLYDRQWEVMFSSAMKVLHDEALVQDIIQEVFLSIWKRRKEIIFKGPIVAYLLKCVRNLTLREIEKDITRKNYQDSLQNLPNIEIENPAVLVELKELEAIIKEAIEQLPPKMREVFLLRKMENRSYKEIAESLNLAENTVKKQLHLAKNRIKEALTSSTIPKYLLIIALLNIYKK